MATPSPEGKVHERKSGHKLKSVQLSTVISVLALAFSIVSGGYSYRSGLENSINETVNKQYESIIEIQKIPIENPNLSHLFALPDEYEEVKKRVMDANSSISSTERARFFLQERAVADEIFTLFERSVVEKSEVFDPFFDSRAAFDSDIISYYTEVSASACRGQAKRLSVRWVASC